MTISTVKGKDRKKLPMHFDAFVAFKAANPNL